MKELKQLTFEKACKNQGLDAKKVVPDFSLFPKKDRKSMAAHAKVVIMIKEANRIANGGKEWIPDYKNTNEPKYEPRFILGGSSGFRFYDFDHWGSLSCVGSRLCFISYEVMMAMVNNKAYMKVYKEFAL